MAAARSVALVVSFLIGCSESGSTATSLFIADYAADAIVQFDGTSGALIGVFASGVEQRVDRPASVQRGPDGNLYTAGFGRGDVVRYDLSSGEMMDVFFADTTLLEEPVELLFHGDELLVLGN